VAEGDAAEEILRLSEAISCDLIVMGSHGRTGLARLLTGSVAEHVLRKATCPVQIVKSPLRAAPAVQAETTAKAGECIDVRPFGSALASAQTRTLLRTPTLKVVRLVVLAGRVVPPHKSRTDVIVHCLEGRVAVNVFESTQLLESGHLLYLPADESHSLRGLEDASLLLTVLAPAG
jgi:quercetin dioxygenase-like cupin family protein